MIDSISEEQESNYYLIEAYTNHVANVQNL